MKNQIQKTNVVLKAIKNTPNQTQPELAQKKVLKQYHHQL